jgi:hypothetical protein
MSEMKLRPRLKLQPPKVPTPKRSPAGVVMSELKLRPLTRSAGLGLARCVMLFARGCRLPAW